MSTIKTPYVPHLFGDAVQTKLMSRNGWLTSGVDSSIAWPQDDVWVLYGNHEYVLMGTKHGEDKRPPSISTPCLQPEIDAAMTRVYLFASVLGWFKGGHVDVTGITWSSKTILYGARDTFTTTLDGQKYFNCNYLPVIDNDKIRLALAFLREGRRLRPVHQPFSFLSFFKVIESQLTPKNRVAWIQANLESLNGDAGKRVAELRAEGYDVGKHLFDSGRCAVAHASLDGVIVDPDIPADRRRIANDLDVMAALASLYIKVEAAVPDESDIYSSLDRTKPWHAMLPTHTLVKLQQGEKVDDLTSLGQLQEARVSVRIWPHDPPDCMRNMRFIAEGYAPGVITFLAISERETLLLRFAVDFANGRVHTLLEDGGLTNQFAKLTEHEIEHYTLYFHSVVGNSLVELCIDERDPVPCEIIIPVNVIPQAPEEMVALALEQFRKQTVASIALAQKPQTFE